ncbi:hypothetical protein BO99DRAFT_404353 [Aspergillus violaceofuscus CBS 115571]|uniref:Uncharacterized protein n=1 Tax=Aspergillus violaceofuscus (strain CBS 115571) TaxID=1450538 RepID=A0A2V5H0H5_ASPV1|nr:hypothetical protein BO99DRAFT_404353 [Aspergillus violaceofuscus CBS 115571]
MSLATLHAAHLDTFHSHMRLTPGARLHGYASSHALKSMELMELPNHGKHRDKNW